MKAAVLHGREDVRIEDLASPPLQPGEVRVRIEAALTCGTDLKVYQRGYHAKMIVPPAVFGHEMAGTISEIAPGVHGWTVGDRVVPANSAPCGECFYCRQSQENLCGELLFLNGAYAESITIPARIVEKNLLRLEEGTSFVQAALTEPLACVLQGVEDCRLQAGQRLLVIGSGPIGLLFAAAARRVGCAVSVAGRGGERLAAAERLGARPIEVPRHGDWKSDLASQLTEKPDVVIEAVGRPETWEAAVALVRKGGLVNFFGGCPAGTEVRLDTGRIHYGALKLIASFHHTPRTIRAALQWLERGWINANDFISGEWPLSRLPELFRSMSENNRAIKTRIRVKE